MPSPIDLVYSYVYAYPSRREIIRAMSDPTVDADAFDAVVANFLVLHLAKPPPDLPVGPPVFRFSDEHEFTRLLHGAGLEDVQVQTVVPYRVGVGLELPVSVKLASGRKPE
jgi:hypothetical protein